MFSGLLPPGDPLYQWVNPTPCENQIDYSHMWKPLPKYYEEETDITDRLFPADFTKYKRAQYNIAQEIKKQNDEEFLHNLKKVSKVSS